MSSPWVNDSNAALLTDLYELTMLQSYFEQGMNDTAVFDFFVRRLPENRNYLVACGLEHLLHYLETLSFSRESIEYLRTLNRFSDSFLKYLANLKFTGDVYAVPEGTLVFANEPIVEIVAPLPQAQLIETFLMNQLHISTLAASKAARVVSAARGKPVLDFGVRRMHGADAGIKAARAFYVAGVAATSNVLAGQVYGIPVAGTMAHSYVQAFDTELDAFRHFVRDYPESMLLVDTYDTLEGVRHVIQLSQELGAEFRVTGVRLDSGDIAGLAREARQLLDSAGLQRLKIYASSSLDEYAIEDLLKSGSPLDGFGVGGKMGVSDDAPLLDTAYKMVEYAGRPRMKLSKDKSSLPGQKRLFRETDWGTFKTDVVAVPGEELMGASILLKFIENGRRTELSSDLAEARARCNLQMEQIPTRFLSLNRSEPAYPVEHSGGLREVLAATLDWLKEDES